MKAFETLASVTVGNRTEALSETDVLIVPAAAIVYDAFRAKIIP